LLQLYLDVCDHFNSLISHSVPVCLFRCHFFSALVANKVLLLITEHFWSSSGRTMTAPPPKVLKVASLRKVKYAISVVINGHRRPCFLLGWK